MILNYLYRDAGRRFKGKNSKSKEGRNSQASF